MNRLVTRMFLAGGLGVVALGGCQSSDMDKDLKRTADRNTIELMKVEKERDALREQVTRLQAQQPTSSSNGTQVAKSDTSGSEELAAARKQVTDLQGELKQTRSALRDAQEQILVLKTSMPAAPVPAPK